jgi:ADP-ribose pyrophosphatase YjhB (NUDIX family)
MWSGGVRVIIADGNGKILLVRQRHEERDIWMLPGGAVEDGETSRDAAIREVMEETGLVVHIRRLLRHVEEVSASRGQRFVLFFLASVIGGRAELGADPELGEDQVLEGIGFFSREGIARLEHVYPGFLRDEIWDEIAEAEGRDPYRLRT